MGVHQVVWLLLSVFLFVHPHATIVAGLLLLHTLSQHAGVGNPTIQVMATQFNHTIIGRADVTTSSRRSTQVMVLCHSRPMHKHDNTMTPS